MRDLRILSVYQGPAVVKARIFAGSGLLGVFATSPLDSGLSRCPLPCRFCPCHGTHYDSSGRVRKGPAPYNLEVSNTARW